MNTQTVCFASSKGGSGKTILTANIASFLGVLGKKVLIIDCDAATHGMTLLYLIEVAKASGDVQRGLFEDRTGNDANKNLSESLVPVGDNVDLLPATFSFEYEFDPESKADFQVLKYAVKYFGKEYDYVFLDAQAGTDVFSRLAMSREIVDTVVLVSEYDPLSAAGIERMKRVVGADLDYSRTWILLNKVLPEFVEKFSEFLSIARYLPPIPWNSEVVRAYAKRRLALDTDKGNEFTLSVMATVRELFGREIESDIEQWSKEKAFELRAPLEEQLALAKEELESLKNFEQVMSRRSMTRGMLRSIYMPTILFAFAYYAVYELKVNIEELNLAFLETNPIFNWISNNIDISMAGLLSFVSILFGLFLVGNMRKIISKRYDGDGEVENLLKRRIAVEDRLYKLTAISNSNFAEVVKSRIEFHNERKIVASSTIEDA